MYRKFVYPLSRRMMQELMKLYQNNVPSSKINDLEFFLGRLYNDGIVQIKKQFENGKFMLFISLTEGGKELLKLKTSKLELA
ncbi:MAG TPA: hypothetical protein VN722_08040 [Hanamia sp.]|nr:hypothetical protein [Hanamia sp.]